MKKGSLLAYTRKYHSPLPKQEAIARVQDALEADRAMRITPIQATENELSFGVKNAFLLEKNSFLPDVCWVAAICAAPTILAKLGITDGKKATCYPGLESQMGSAQMQSGAAAVQDGKLLTGAGPGTAIDFGLLLVRALRGEETAKKVYDGLVYRLARPE